MAKQNTEIPNNTNDADAAPAAPKENSAQALVQHARKLLGDLDADLRAGTAKLERKHGKGFDHFFNAMYAAIVAVEESGEREAFLASSGIRAHGNVKNPYFLMVRAFADSTCTLLKGRLCKKAQVVQLARMQDVKPADFEKWKKLWPIERACDELRRLTNSPRQKNGLEPKLDTRGLTGEHAVLVSFSPDTGRHRLIRLLSTGDFAKPSAANQHDDIPNTPIS